LDDDPTMLLWSDDPATVCYFQLPLLTLDEKMKLCTDIALGVEKYDPTSRVIVFKKRGTALVPSVFRFYLGTRDAPKMLANMIDKAERHDDECIVCLEKINTSSIVCHTCTAQMCVPCYRKMLPNDNRCPLCREVL